jgi:hypothetical protein
MKNFTRGAVGSYCLHGQWLNPDQRSAGDHCSVDSDEFESVLRGDLNCGFDVTDHG